MFANDNFTAIVFENPNIFFALLFFEEINKNKNNKNRLLINIKNKSKNKKIRRNDECSKIVQSTNILSI